MNSNQDGKVEPSSDYETSDANSYSLNNSLSEEEFSIGSSNIDSGGLKLTISFRKRSCDDEVDNSTRANLNNTDDQCSHDSAPEDKYLTLLSMEKQNSEDDQTKQVDPLDETGMDPHIAPSNDKGDMSTTHTDQPDMTPATSPAKMLKLATSKTIISTENQDAGQSERITAESISQEVALVQVCAPDVLKSCENAKPSKRFKHIGSSCSLAQDIHDHLDASLPNVSPDSGIISLDESTFGNESPNSVANGELGMDLQQGAHSATLNINVVQQVNKKAELESSPLTSVDESKKNGDEESQRSGKINNNLPSDKFIEKDTSDSSKEGKASAETAAEESALPKNICAIDNNTEEEDLPDSILPTSGNGIILSSPNKISQAMGRKKRGRPPKKKNSLLLKHKKSTLYSSLYENPQVSNESVHKDSNLQANPDLKKGSINSCSEILGAKEICKDPLVTNTKHSEVNNSTCDNPILKKKSPGRPKGSVTKKKVSSIGFRRTFRNLSKANTSVPANTSATEVSSSALKKPSGVPVKRPRGRPRKNPLPPESQADRINPPADSSVSYSASTGNLDKASTHSMSDARKKIKTNAAKPGRRKYVRKKLYTQNKKKSQSVPDSRHCMSGPRRKKGSASNKSKLTKANSVRHKEFQHSRQSTSTSPEKGKVDHGSNKSKSSGCVEKSVFQDNDLDALLKSVNSSISQFPNEDASSDIISNLNFDNPFKAVQPPSFPKMTSLVSPRIVKPKPKKPNVHVMMRRTKRKKKKKLISSKPVPTNVTSSPPKKLSAFSAAAAQKKLGKFSVSPQKKTGTFGSSASEKKLSFFTSCVQPSKILASSRLNVFRSGTGVDGSHRSGTPTDVEQADGSEKRCKKRHRLLYRKSKHKNIIDPVFAADLDTLVSGLKGLAIPENPADTFIRVRPGEMPLPSIFRVIKIDVNRKLKERIQTPETFAMDKAKLMKPGKETPSPYEMSSPTTFKPVLKSGRKKSSSDQTVDQREQPCDQWLPPKKRHRLVNLDSSQSGSSQASSVNDVAVAKKDPKRKGRRPKKSLAQEENKYEDRAIAGRLGQHFVGQELTIDTSSYTTGGSSACTPSLSPCLSRLSTRSSTLPSLSSPSPTGSAGFRSRHPSKNNPTPACPVHSFSSSIGEKSSCAECRLLEQSMSPGVARSCRTTLRSLSTQAAESSNSSERPTSSSDCSPLIKGTSRNERLPGRNDRKRRKSSNLSADESDSSPPRLEKNTSLSPNAYRDRTFFSDPPEITNSPLKSCVSPRRSSGNKSRHLSSNSSVSPKLPRKKLCSSVVQQRSLRQPSSSNQSTKQTVSGRKSCNKTSNSQQSASKSVISSSCSEFDPLPLEHCSKSKIVEEIRAATTCESEDSTSSEADEPSFGSNNNGLGQLPRKRFQRVGLYSDFYKDEEPRKRCENMVRYRDKLVYVKEDHEFGLIPQPLHIGQYYIRHVQDFQLPYDIYWQHIHQQLPKKPEPKIKFRNIRTNVYSDSKVNTRKIEIPRCSCSLPQSGSRGCQDDCLNRMIYTECSPSTCLLGENCDNQRIQKHEWVPGLEKFLTSDRGFGVRTRNAVKSGQFILEYLGEVVSETEFRRRMMEEYSEECHHYALHLDSGSLIDGYRMGNIGRYVNHSCQPNCEMQKWNVNGLYRMVLFALRDIERNEELSYDYNFDPFNQETQQECRCGSSECRGVIGVKTQRSSSTCKQPEKMSDDPKDKRKSKLMNKKVKDKHPPDSVPVQPLAKPMTFKERCYARKHRTFLVRNVDRVRNQRHPGQELGFIAKEELNILDSNKMNSLNSDVMLAHLNERSVKTRLAAYAKDNPEMGRRHQLAQIFDKMLTELLSLKDEDGNILVTPLMSLPTRKKQPQYYQVVRDPIDMSMIKQRVKTGYYDHLSSFNSDIMLLFSNVELYCGPKSDLGQVILKLRRVLNCVKTDVASQIDELLGHLTTKSLMDTELEKLEQASSKAGHDEPEEDIIRCICGVTRDEGLMLQCEKCWRWQHCDCVRASGEEEHYQCDRCEPRYYDQEILLNPLPADALPDCTHYMTLVKDDVQYAVGDCVYVMRDCKRTPTGTPLRSSHRLMASVNPDKLDIFRLEQLWKDPKGERFASGTPYLRPQETFHEPTRKFYHNELFRTPNFEIIPMDLVMGKCVVMDPNTYCKGRPKGVKEQDVYICEYRVDKTAHLFHKIQKIWYPINTGKFCFDWFDTKLTIRRTFSPHEVPDEYKRKAERNMAGVVPAKSEAVKQEEKFDVKKNMKNHVISHGKVKMDDSLKNDLKLKAEVKVNVKKGGVQKKEMGHAPFEKLGVQKAKEFTKKERKHRLEKILTRLLNNIPGKQKVDLTYLLDEGKRVRKKVTK